MILKFSIFFLTILTCQFSYSQSKQEELVTADSSVVIKKKKVKKSKKEPFDYSTLDPKKATIYALFPGLGQAYNRRYWKIPIIYGLGTITVISAINANIQYETYLKGLNTLTEKNLDYYPIYIEKDGTTTELSESQLKQEKDIYKRKRDFNIILTLAIYGLQIVDANVDAHLLKFHNSKNFLSLTPTVINHSNNFSPGLSLALNLQ